MTNIHSCEETDALKRQRKHINEKIREYANVYKRRLSEKLYVFSMLEGARNHFSDSNTIKRFRALNQAS